jgi:hypothetical protein
MQGAPMAKFDPKSLIDLDECVLKALDLFTDPKTEFPRPDVSRFHRPLVVGSGNAFATGRIIFDASDAVFADEGTFQGRLQAVQDIDGVIVISASGGKHAPIIAKEVKPRGLPVLLFTCNPKALAGELVDEVHVFPSRAEPYTYNTSTYMGMILSCLSDNPRAEAQRIRNFVIDNVDPVLERFDLKRFRDFNAFYLLVPEPFELIRIMFTTKFVELFGRRLARDVFTWEQSKHATTVVEAPNELFLSFGRENTTFGIDRLDIPLPLEATVATTLAVGYYVIGKIQAQKPPWFKNGIESFAQRASAAFGQTINPIVNYA